SKDTKDSKDAKGAKAEPDKGDSKESEAEPDTPQKPKEMRAFVVADAGAFSDLALGNVLGNQVLLVDAVRWLAGEESFAGQTNVEEDLRIEHTKQQDLAWYYSTIMGAPALILGLGIWYSRRTRRPRRRARK
ncbi:hypothetical protein ACFL5O_12300, partial [Myxococcota bacterium]